MSGLMAALKDINKKFKKTNPDIMFDPNKRVEAIPTGCLYADLITGCGGFPRGRITEVFGMEHSGKTALFLASSKGVVDRGGISIFFDFEGAYSREFTYNTFGLTDNEETFIVFQPDTIEEGGDILDLLIKNKVVFDLIGFDSVEAMKPKSIIEGSIDKEKRVGEQAQKIAQFVAKIRVHSRQYNYAAVFINQMRAAINTSRVEQNIGTGSGFNMMESYTTPGGLSLRFYASLRLKLEYGGKVDDESAIDPIHGGLEKRRVSNIVKVINIKNKVGTPFLKGKTKFDFPDDRLQKQGGWDNFNDIQFILGRRGRMRQAGSSFQYTGLEYDWKNVGAKVESEKQFKANPELMADARALVYFLIEEEREKRIALAANAFVEAEDEEGYQEPLIEEAVEGEDYTSEELYGGEDQVNPIDDVPVSSTEVVAKEETPNFEISNPENSEAVEDNSEVAPPITTETL